eukprot:7244486-Pyramimonas_sp.AAC.1
MSPMGPSVAGPLRNRAICTDRICQGHVPCCSHTFKNRASASTPRGGKYSKAPPICSIPDASF